MRGAGASEFPLHFHLSFQNYRLLAKWADELIRVLKVDDDAADRRRLVVLIQHYVATDVDLGTWGGASCGHADSLRNYALTSYRRRIWRIGLGIRGIHMRRNQGSIDRVNHALVSRQRTPGPDSPRSRAATATRDRKSTRLNSSHGSISYAVF